MDHSGKHSVAGSLMKMLKEARENVVKAEVVAEGRENLPVDLRTAQGYDVSNFFLTSGEFWANFERLVLGCIETNLCK